MWIDIASVVIRALSFIALFQAAGVAFFTAIFGRSLNASDAIVRLGQWSAVCGVALVAMHHLLDAGRMAGELPGVFDASLQYLSITSSTGASNALRLLGLIVLAVFIRRTDGASRLLSFLGAVVVCLAFMITGHTSVHAQRWLLAPLLSIHLLAVAFWFGALWPLVFVSRREPAQTATRVIERFSLIAAWWVPFIALAGVVMAYALLPSVSALLEPYGLLLLAKLLGFAVLMGLAALNKWRLGPAIASGDVAIARTFRRSVIAEFVLICMVLSVTAVMTGFFSPEGE